MGLIIRQSVKASIASYFGTVIGMANVLFITTKFLSTEQIGLTRVLFDTSLLFASFAQLGTSFITDKFFPYFKNEEQKHNGFLVFLLTYSFAGFVIFSIIYLLARNIITGYYVEKSPELLNYFYHVLVITFFTMYQSIAEAYSRIHGRIVVPTIIREIFLKSANGLLILGYGLHLYSFDGFVGLFITCNALAVIFSLLYIKSLGRLYIKPDFSLINRKLLREIAGYGLFILLGGIGTILSQKVDVIMLPAMQGLDYTAIYGIAFLIASVIEIPRRAIGQISSPILSQAWKNNDLHQIEDLYKKSANNQLIAGALLFLLMWCSVDDLFNIIPKGELYRQGKIVILIISLSRLFDMASGLNGEIILYSRYFKFATVAVFLLVVLTIVNNLVFIPIYALNGAAIAAAISVVIFSLIKSGFLWVKFRIQPYSFSTVVMVLIIGFIYFAATLLPGLPGHSFVAIMVRIIIRSCIVAGLFLPLVYFCNVSEDLNKLVVTYWQKIAAYLKKKQNS